MDTARLVWQGGMPMIRQLILISRRLFLGAVVVGSTGCETLHSSVRHDDNDKVSRKDDDDPTEPKSVDSDVSKVSSVDSNDKDPQPFFGKTRQRSSFTPFSPEAQQIEKDLGVY
jgi:hypothetical protein